MSSVGTAFFVFSQDSGNVPQVGPAAFQVQGMPRLRGEAVGQDVLLDVVHEVDEVGSRAEHRLAVVAVAPRLIGEESGVSGQLVEVLLPRGDHADRRHLLIADRAEEREPREGGACSQREPRSSGSAASRRV